MKNTSKALCKKLRYGLSLFKCNFIKPCHNSFHFNKLLLSNIDDTVTQKRFKCCSTNLNKLLKASYSHRASGKKNSWHVKPLSTLTLLTNIINKRCKLFYIPNDGSWREEKSQTLFRIWAKELILHSNIPEGKFSLNIFCNLNIISTMYKHLQQQIHNW